MRPMQVEYKHSECGQVVALVDLADESTPWAVYAEQMADHKHVAHKERA